MDIEKVKMEKNIFYLDNFSKVIYYQLDNSDKKLNSLRLSKMKISNETYLFYKVESGLVIKVDETFFLYSNLEDFEKIIKFPLRQNIFLGKNPYGEKVLLKRSDIIKQLAINFRIDSNQLNYTRNSLRIIDSIIAKANVDDTFMDENFLGLLIYLGEVLRKEGVADWKLSYNSEFDFWIPLFVNKEFEIPLSLRLFEFVEECRTETDDSLKQPMQLTYVLMKELSSNN